MTTLFRSDQRFKLSSGAETDYKIDCEYLTDHDIMTFGIMIRRHVGNNYYYAIGVPSGGLRLANHLNYYATKTSTIVLIIDDVLTTGASMEKARNMIDDPYRVRGYCIFARGPCPDWVTPIFTLNKEIEC